MSLRNIIAISLIIGLLLSVILQANSNRHISNLEDSSAQLYDDFEISELLDDLLFKISTVESAQRAYVITGDSTFLVHYNESKLDVDYGTEDLTNFLYEHNLDQEADEFVKLTTMKLSFSDTVVNLYNSKGAEFAFDLVEDGRGHEIMEKILNLTTRINTTIKLNINTLLDQNNASLDAYSFWTYLGISLIFLIVILSLVLLFIDARYRDRITKQIKEALDTAHKSIKIKEQFMANMSHEIRTPLNAILGYLGLLKKTNADKQQKEYIEIVSNSGNNLLEIVNDILDFSKIEAGMIRIENVPFNLSTVFKSVEQMFEQKVRDKNLTFITSVDSDIPEILEGDPNRLSQILINLCGNAIKFTKKGEVVLKAAVKRSNQGMYFIEMTVEDTGIGIPSTKIREIFDEFNQGNPEITREFGGTGLGLSIVKNLIELQDGSIRVESVEGRGSIFTIVIPYHESNVIFENKVAENLTGFTSQTEIDAIQILLIEDNLLNQKLAQTVLTNLGYNVELAENGAVALDKLENSKFDAILMDLQMPIMDGYECARLIRTKLKIDVPIIAMTAHAFEGEREKCIIEGMTDYFTKPYTEQEIDRIIRKNIKSLRSTVAGKLKSKSTESTISDSDFVTDLSYLITMSKGNIAFVMNMIDLFVEQNMEDLTNLENAHISGQIATMKSLAHKMKTSVRMIGMSELVETTLVKIEKYDPQKITQIEMNASINLIKGYCERAITELLAYKHSKIE